MDGSLNAEKRSMKKLINKLNEPLTPDRTKLQFAQLIGIDINTKNLKNFKSKNLDFQEILSTKTASLDKDSGSKKFAEGQTRGLRITIS
jgi:hypothetical protein